MTIFISLSRFFFLSFFSLEQRILILYPKHFPVANKRALLMGSYGSFLNPNYYIKIKE